MVVLRIRLSDHAFYVGLQVRSGAKGLRLKTNAGAIDHNVITQSAAKNGRMIAHGVSMAQVGRTKQIHRFGNFCLTISVYDLERFPTRKIVFSNIGFHRDI